MNLGSPKKERMEENNGRISNVNELAHDRSQTKLPIVQLVSGKKW